MLSSLFRSRTKRYRVKKPHNARKFSGLRGGYMAESDSDPYPNSGHHSEANLSGSLFTSSDRFSGPPLEAVPQVDELRFHKPSFSLLDDLLFDSKAFAEEKNEKESEKIIGQPQSEPVIPEPLELERPALERPIFEKAHESEKSLLSYVKPKVTTTSKLRDPRLRRGFRCQGDLLHALLFSSSVFDSAVKVSPTASLNRLELLKKLKTVALSKEESEFLCELLVYHIGNIKTTSVSYTSLVQFLSFAFKAARQLTLNDFAFALLDQNEDEFVSQSEFKTFLTLFWNRKLGNILDTPGAFDLFQSFVDKAQTSESFEFFLTVKPLLKNSFVSFNTFEQLVNNFVAENSPKELNLSYKQRRNLLDTFATEQQKNMSSSESDSLNKSVKSEVLKEAVSETSSLLQQNVLQFVSNEEAVNNCVNNIWSEIFKKKEGEELSKEEFIEGIQKVDSFVDFLSDVKRVMRRAWKVSEEMRVNQNI